MPARSSGTRREVVNVGWSIAAEAGQGLWQMPGELGSVCGACPSWRKRKLAPQQRVVADRLAACEIRRFLGFRNSTNSTACGVGEGRKAAAKPWPLDGD